MARIDDLVTLLGADRWVFTRVLTVLSAAFSIDPVLIALALQASTFGAARIRLFLNSAGHPAVRLAHPSTGE